MYEKAFFHRRGKLFRLFFEYVRTYVGALIQHMSVPVIHCYCTSSYSVVWFLGKPSQFLAAVKLDLCTSLLFGAKCYMFVCPCVFVSVQSAWMQYHEMVRIKRQKEKQQIAVASLHYRRTFLQTHIMQWKVRMGGVVLLCYCAFVNLCSDGVGTLLWHGLSWVVVACHVAGMYRHT